MDTQEEMIRALKLKWALSFSLTCLLRPQLFPPKTTIESSCAQTFHMLCKLGSQCRQSQITGLCSPKYLVTWWSPHKQGAFHLFWHHHPKKTAVPATVDCVQTSTVNLVSPVLGASGHFINAWLCHEVISASWAKVKTILYFF